jgi:hypothetical protein
MDKSTFILIYSECPTNKNLIVGIPIYLPPGENIDYDLLRHEVGTDIPIRMKSLRMKGNVKRYGIEIPWDSKRFIHDDTMVIISRNTENIIHRETKLTNIRMYIPRELKTIIQKMKEQGVENYNSSKSGNIPELETLLKDCYLLLKPHTLGIRSNNESKQSEKQGESEQFKCDEDNIKSREGTYASIYWRARVFSGIS